MSILDKVIYLFVKSKNERTQKISKNTFLTVLVKLISLPISFVLISLTINYLDSESYGIWLTISSIVAWMSFFDIGINNGLRNKLTENLAINNIELSRKYVSTTYAILFSISAFIFLLFICCNYFLDWSYILNTKPSLSKVLSNVAIIVFGYFCLKFVLSTINIVLLSNHSPATASLVSLIEQLSSFVVIFLLTKFTDGNLLYLALGLCIVPILVLFYLNLYFFRRKLSFLVPKLKFVDFSLSKDLMGIGFKFFIIQIAGIIQFQTANFIIIQNFGANEVTIYNIAFKYFSILTMIMSTLMIPLWSSSTDAFAKNQFGWIRNTEIKFRKVALFLILIGVVMLIFSDDVYDIWLGKNRIIIPFKISFLMLLFSIISVFGGIYCTILNGISALDIQFKASMVSPVVFFLFTYIFITYFKFGISSIILASIIANFNAYLLAPLQFIYIFYRNKKNNI